MQIKVNGNPYHCSAATILALTEALGLNLRQVAIEKNREIVPKSTYAEVRIAEGDEIEVVKFIGGG